MYKTHPEATSQDFSRPGVQPPPAPDGPAVPTAEARIAKSVGLRYVSDTLPGIRRLGAPGRFRYVGPTGNMVRDQRIRERVRALVIPPAWQRVWICPYENGHIQVTARDARGRKQYRYHSRWRETRDANKYEQLHDFVRALPAMRKAVGAHLRLPGLPREKVLAAVVKLLETTFIRVGNEKYARENGSFGLTTLRNRHVRIRGQTLQFDFRGKSGKQHHIEFLDARLAAIVRRCRDLPGQELFQYLDENGEPRTISSADVNEYLSSISSGQSCTAKDFRTWAGTVLAALALHQHKDLGSQTRAKKNVVEAIKQVAQRLGNTPAICRKCYVHPGLLKTYFAGRLAGLPVRCVSDTGALELTRRNELAVLRTLQPPRRERRKVVAN